MKLISYKHESGIRGGVLVTTAIAAHNDDTALGSPIGNAARRPEGAD